MEPICVRFTLNNYVDLLGLLGFRPFSSFLTDFHTVICLGFREIDLMPWATLLATCGLFCSLWQLLACIRQLLLSFSHFCQLLACFGILLLLLATFWYKFRCLQGDLH